MNWKEFLVELFNIVSKESTQKEWDTFYGKIWEFDNLKRIAYNTMRIYYGSEKKQIDWWKKLFREILNFSKLQGKTRKELLQISDKICSSYPENEVLTIFTYIVFAMTGIGDDTKKQNN